MKKVLMLLAMIIWATNGFSAFKIVAVPDTQNLAEFTPSRMTGQAQWIANNAATENIAFVSYLGDIVNDGYDPTQWANGTAAIDLLDGVLPYSVCLGNHDFHDRTNRVAGAAEYIAHFGSSRYSGYSWYKGSFRELNHYQIFSADSRDWLHINFEYMPDSEELLWAQRVIDANPTLPVIVSTHAFLNKDSELGADPASSQMGTPSNGGEAQWYQFVKQNDQIFLVLNGHYFDNGGTGYGVANTNIVNSYGHDVFMMCVNYQGVSNSDAHFRILEFDSTAGQINATTYDPNTDDWLTDSANQFTLSMDFTARLGSFSSRETFTTIQAANITVIENDLNNSNNSVTVTIPAGQSTADISVVAPGTTEYTDQSNGDYYLQVGSQIEDDRLGGIMLASVAENGRVSMDGSNYYHIVAAPAGGHGQYSVAVHTTINESQYPGAPDGIERDVNVAAAYFPFDQGWTCGRVENYNNNTTNWCVVGSENIELGVNLTQLPQGDIDTALLQKVGGPTAPYWRNPETYRGIWNLEIPGVDSISDGILLVCGGKNEDNYAAASPWRDGSGWQISVQDSGSGGGTESDPWNFVYVPYSTENIVAGRVSNKNGITSGTKDVSENYTFSVVSNAPGTVRLTIPGHSPSDGTLIISTENEWYNSDDFTTYEPDGSTWLVQTRDLTGATPLDASSTQFAFLFIPFANAPSEPGIEYTAFWNTNSGDWLAEANWKDTEAMHRWGVPGWVAGNPKNTGGSTDPRWNLSQAIIESGTANVTPASKPDGIVADLDLGYNGGTATLNISDDFSVGDPSTTVSIGVGAGSTGIVNMASGVFESGCKRVWVGASGYGLFNQTGGDVQIMQMSMADSSSSVGEYRISGGSLMVTNAISGDQDTKHAGKFTVSGSGATSIETMRIYGWADTFRFELDAGGTTLIKVTPDTGATYDAAYADLRRAIIEVDTLPGFNGVEGDVYDVLWVEDSALTGDYDGTIRFGEPYTTLSNCSTVASFKWRIVNKQVGGKDGQMLQLIVGSNYDSRYVDGQRTRFTITDTGIAGVAGIAFDPTSTSGGVYDRIYAVDSSGDNAKEGLYALDTIAGTVSARLVDDEGSRPYDVDVDTNGNVYVCYGYAPEVFKYTDPLGTISSVQMLGNYGGSGDDDPDGLAMAPIGFGGGYNEGADVVLFDSGLDVNGDRAISVIDKDSTAAAPSVDILSVESSAESYRMETSDFDGKIYYTYYHPHTADLNGSNRVYIVRMDSAANKERIFLDVPPEEVAKLDDTIAVNPVDGSVWMGFYVYATDEMPIRTIYRVDVANAVLAQGTSDYLASTARVIYNVGMQNIAKNGMAISPDGTQLAVGNPSGTDGIIIFDIVPSVSAYIGWKQDYGVTDSLADPDGDGLNNLTEYGLGGDPTNALDQGISPTVSVDGDWMDYVYPKLSDFNSGISYSIEITDDLIYGVWTNVGYTVTGTGYVDPEFNAVTNRISTAVEDQQFIRLIIEEE